MTTWFPLESHPDYLWVSNVLLAGWPHGFPSNPTQLHVSKRCPVCGMTTWFPLDSHPDYLWVSDVLLAGWLHGFPTNPTQNYMWVSDVLFAGWPHGFPSNPTQTTCELEMFCLRDDHMVSPRIPPKLHVSKRCSVCGMTTWFPLESHPDYLWVRDVLFAGWLHGFPSKPTQTTCELVMFACGMTTWFPLESHPDYTWVSNVLFAGWPQGFPSDPTQTTCE